MPALYERGAYSEIEAHLVDHIETSEALFVYLSGQRPELLSLEFS